MPPVLSIKNLSFSYNGTEILSKVSFNVDAGDYLALVGPNGAGKTTLIKTLLGLLNPNSGMVKLFGVDIQKFHDWRRVGYLPQRVATFNPLFPATVNEVVGLGLLSQKTFPKHLDRADQQKIDAALADMQISDLKNRPASKLSGGQQQRVFLARALVSSPELLILDEPGTALDPASREHFYDLIYHLNKKHHLAIILISHDISDHDTHADKLLFLDKHVVYFGALKDYCEVPSDAKHFDARVKSFICHRHD